MKAFWNLLDAILWFTLLFAACSGVTVNGVHHQVGCSCDRGVEIQ